MSINIYSVYKTSRSFDVIMPKLITKHMEPNFNKNFADIRVSMIPQGTMVNDLLFYL